MIALSLSLIIFNLALGYVAGVMFRCQVLVDVSRLPRLPHLRRPPSWLVDRVVEYVRSLWRRGHSHAETAELATPDANIAESSQSGELSATVRAVVVDMPPAMEDIPQEWLETLATSESSLEIKSYVEAAAQVLRLEVAKYRERLIECDERARKLRESAETADLASLVGDLMQVNVDWLAKQSAAADVLHERQQAGGPTAKFGSRLEDTLLEQQAQIETTCSNIGHLDLATDLALAADRLLGEIGRLVDLAHSLRDRMQETLLAVLWIDGRIGTIDRRMQKDSQTGLLSRAGLERIFFEWWRDDSSRTRLLSLGMLDIDRFGRINATHGPRAGDQFLRAIADLMAAHVRSDRGFERAGRYDGQRFVILFGDAGPHQALTAVERIRQTLQATEFHRGSTETQLTVSCGAIEVGPKDDLNVIWQRLTSTLRQAKMEGRNRTFVDRGEGPASTAPPEFNIRPKVVELDFAEAGV